MATKDNDLDTFMKKRFFNAFARGFVKGVLTPMDAMSTMMGLQRQHVPDDFKYLNLGSPQTDCDNIRRDFVISKERIYRESPEIKASTPTTF